VNRSFRVATAMLASVAAGLAPILAPTITSAVTRPVSASAPRCATSALTVWLGIGAGQNAAGSTYYPMEFTNVSGQTCQLVGFPVVSASHNGQQVGSPAQRVQSVPKRTVTLTPGATAHTVLQIVNVANFPADACTPVSATALRVNPPHRRTATEIPFSNAAGSFSFSACSVEGTIFMSVRPIQAGVGVPGY